jgi:D-alanine-D-alanine ligase
MARTVVGVLRGGTSSEYDLSLRTGAVILNALPDEAYDVRDIFIDKQGYWHTRGIPVEPARALSQVDVVVNGLHGGDGENGTIQRLLDTLGVAYTGSRASAARHSLNKIESNSTLRSVGIPVPRAVGFTRSTTLDSGEMAQLVFSQFGPPYMVKPAAEGASHGIILAPTIVALPHAIADVIDSFGAALVEEYLMGEEATVGVIDGFRDEELYVLPPTHVSYPDAPFMHYDHHIGGHLRHNVPSHFATDDKQRLMRAARDAHRALGLRHFSRADFIVTKRGPYLLEVNALPGLYESAAFPKMLESVGSSVGDFLRHSIQLSRRL